MKTQLLISSICFFLVVITGLIFASLYLFRKRFMPYHAEAVGKPWIELDRNTRILIIALMRVVGGGWLVASLAIGLIFYFAFLNGESWAAWVILLAGLSITIPTLIATLIVRTRTNGKPPVFAAVIAMLLLFTGFITALL
jgi:hypothetical protein